MTITASAFERVAACPGSAVLPQANTTSEWAMLGNEAHEAVCAFVMQLREGMSEGAALVNVPAEWQPACEELGEDARSYTPEAAFAMDVRTLKARYLGSDIGRAYRIGPTEVAGTADLAGLIDGRVVVVDLKSGWGPVTLPGRNKQLRLLALMACQVWGATRATVAVLRCHEGEAPTWQWAELDELDLDETLAEMHRALRAVDVAAIAVQAGRLPDVAEGPYCKYCPAMTSCPAKTALIKRLANGSEADELELLKPLDARTAGVAWERLGHAKRLLQRIESACHAALHQFGALELPSGKLLRKVTTDGNERIDGSRAYDVVVELLGREMAEEATKRTMTKTALADALRRHLGRAGAAREREALEEMRRRGIITRGTQEKLVEIDRE